MARDPNSDEVYDAAIESSELSHFTQVLRQLLLHHEHHIVSQLTRELDSRLPCVSEWKVQQNRAEQLQHDAILPHAVPLSHGSPTAPVASTVHVGASSTRSPPRTSLLVQPPNVSFRHPGSDGSPPSVQSGHLAPDRLVPPSSRLPVAQRLGHSLRFSSGRHSLHSSPGMEGVFHGWGTKSDQIASLSAREAALNQAVNDQQRVRPSMFPEDDATIGPTQTQTQQLQGQTRKLIASKFFEVLVLVVIMSNIAMIGVYGDWAVKNPAGDPPSYFQELDLFFNVFFLVEQLLRVCAVGLQLYSFTNPAAFWNRFDLLLVVLAWLEEILKVLLANVPGLSAMRMMRIFRFCRIARVVRVAREFHDLRIMVWGIGSSLKSLVWALVLLFILSYMFGVLILEFVPDQLAALDQARDYRSRDELTAWWGSLGQTIYVLYQAICGGVDWGTAVVPLLNISPVFAFIFCMYIAMATLCVLNVITGVFVENTKRMQQKDETTLFMETIESRRQWLEEIKSLWRMFSKSDVVERHTFCDKIKDVRIQALFRRLGVEVEVENPMGFFRLLDLTGTGRVHVDEFAMGIEMLHGQAKNIDMARLRAAVSIIMKRLEDLTRICAALQDESKRESAALNLLCKMEGLGLDKAPFGSSPPLMPYQEEESNNLFTDFCQEDC